MDIRARDVLSKIRGISGAEQSILAGGAPRDEIIGIEPRDYDIFIPSQHYKVFTDVVNLVNKMAGIEPKKKNKAKSSSGYSDHHVEFVREIPYEGIILQLIGFYAPNDDKFAEAVLKTFDYGLCKVYYEGSSIIRDTEDFQNDLKNRTLTLMNLKKLGQLPKAITRFNHLNERLGGNWTFTCSNLKIDYGKIEIEDDFDSKVADPYNTVGEWGNFVTRTVTGVRAAGNAIRPVAPAIQARNNLFPVGEIVLNEPIQFAQIDENMPDEFEPDAIPFPDPVELR